jgi:hypothetical protein
VTRFALYVELMVKPGKEEEVATLSCECTLSRSGRDWHGRLVRRTLRQGDVCNL